MIRVIKAEQRHTRNVGWLQTAWLFSFDEYYDPSNIQFGALRVFNDDTIQPGKGFPGHPHREAEIITIPLSGAITHQDNMGNTGTIPAGDVQRMTAGTGVVHAEMNTGNEPVHLYQIWFIPDTPSLPPSYAQRHFAADEWHNRLLPIASGRGLPNTVPFHTDATIFRGDFDHGVTFNYPIDNYRCIFIYLTAGSITVNGIRLATHDQARISKEQSLDIHVNETASLVLIDLPPCER
ncbi:MAG TPA: pirin family protein [Armatimonadota bacterium]|nr:pirin family protein [Armatimonadota bacterium]